MDESRYQDFQAQYKALATKSRTAVSRLLDEAGRELDASLSRSISATYEEAPTDLGWFPPAVAHALVWSFHAFYEDEGQASWDRYVARVLRYFGGDSRVLDVIGRQHYGRYGEESLQNALWAYREFYRARPDLTLTDVKSASELRANEDDTITWLQTEGKSAGLTGIGPWLALAPHKIHLLRRQELWEADDVNEVVQPLGGIVMRSIRQLTGHGVISNPGFSGRYTADADPGLDSIGDVYLAHMLHTELARAGNSNTLHINGGLWVLGHR